MKKIAVFLTLSLLFCLASSPVFAEESTFDPIVIRFDSPESLVGVEPTADTAISYDADENAMLLEAIDDGDGTWTLPLRVEISTYAKQGISIADYPFVAIRFKTCRDNFPARTIHLRTDLTEQARKDGKNDINGTKYINYLLATPGYQPTDDWQGLVMNANEASEAYLLNKICQSKDSTGWGAWERLILTFINPSYVYDGDYLYVESIGLYHTLEEANNAAGIEEEEILEARGTLSYFLNSESELDTCIQWDANDDTQVTFNSEKRVMEVLAKDAQSGDYADGKLTQNVAGFEFFLDETTLVSPKYYTVLGVGLTLSNPNSKPGSMTVILSDGREYAAEAIPAYQDNTDYQALYLKLDDLGLPSDAYISKVQIALSDGTAGEESFLVEWIGLFESMEDAVDFADVPSDTQDTTDEITDTSDMKTTESVQNTDTEPSSGEIDAQNNGTIVIIAVVVVVLVAGVVIVWLIRKKRGNT